MLLASLHVQMQCQLHHVPNFNVVDLNAIRKFNILCLLGCLQLAPPTATLGGLEAALLDDFSVFILPCRCMEGPSPRPEDRPQRQSPA